jgi:general secretion pathway protein C
MKSVMAGSRMDERRIVKLLWAIKAALVGVLAYVGFEVVTSHLHLGTALGPRTASGDKRMTDTVPPPPEARSPSDYTEIVRRNLFAEANGTSNPPSVSSGSKTLDSTPSAEELGLRLVGTIAGGPAVSRVNIQDVKSNTTGVYRIGDTVAAATVEAIERDTVVLRCEGRDRVLRLQSGATGNNKSDPGKDKLKNAREPVPPDAPSTQAVSPSARAGYVTEVFHNATIDPYVRNGRTEGLRITGLDKIPMAQALGLKNGDIVQSVNGQPLTSKQKAFQVLMKAKTQSKVSIQLLRDGKSKDLSFDL